MSCETLALAHTFLSIKNILGGTESYLENLGKPLGFVEQSMEEGVERANTAIAVVEAMTS